MIKYEQTLAELEEFLDNCRRQKFSGENIIVNRDQIDEYISELKLKTPEEIKKYQRIISNREAIMDSAKEKAAEMLEQARAETSELISEHEIMQQAYQQANAMVDDASAQAQQILGQAVADADAVRMGAMQYTDESLANLQNIIMHTMESVTARYDAFMKAMSSSLEVITANRNELAPQEEEAGSEELEELPEIDNAGENYEDYTVDIEE
jgi:cell division septum initiation protein DivIVA